MAVRNALTLQYYKGNIPGCRLPLDVSVDHSAHFPGGHLFKILIKAKAEFSAISVQALLGCYMGDGCEFHLSLAQHSPPFKNGLAYECEV